MIELEKILYRYPQKNQSIFNQMNLHIQKGEVLVIKGANGSGKTTLLRILAGIVPRFTGGELEGRRIFEGSIYDSIDSNRFGMLFHGGDQQFIQARVDQEILYILESQGFDVLKIQNAFNSIVKDFELDHLIHREIHTLSSGETQLLKLALTFVLRPKVILMDEPLSHLDVEMKKKILNLLVKLKDTYELTYIIAEHDPSVWEIFGSDLKYIDFSEQSMAQKLTPLIQKKSTANPKILTEIKNIHFAHGSRQIFSNFTKTIHQGELIVVEGANGSGKTTLLNLLMGNLLPSSGNVIHDQSIRIKILTNPVIQNFFSMKVKDELALEKTVQKPLELFKIAQFQDDYVFDLSQGEQRKVALNLLTQSQPNLLLLDEPFLHLDKNSKIELMNGILDLIDMGSSVVLTAHESKSLSSYADQIWHLESK